MTDEKQQPAELTVGGWWAHPHYLSEYRRATQSLIAAALSLPSEPTAMPAAFLVRHTLELGLKYSIAELHGYLDDQIQLANAKGETPPAFRPSDQARIDAGKSHVLGDLLGHFFEAIAGLGFSIDPVIEVRLKRLVADLETIERDEEARFRYSTVGKAPTKKNPRGQMSRSFEQPTTIPLRSFGDELEAVLVELHGNLADGIYGSSLSHDIYGLASEIWNELYELGKL